MDILNKIYGLLSNISFDVSFWAVCLVALLAYLGNRTSCRLPQLSLILIINSLKALCSSAHGVHSSMLSGAKLSSSGTESFPFPCHTLLVHLFVLLQLFVEPYLLLDQPVSASMPSPTMILVYQGYVFSPTELSCPSLGTAWTSWGMFPLTWRVILFVGVELPLPFSLGSLSNSLRCYGTGNLTLFFSISLYHFNTDLCLST